MRSLDTLVHAVTGVTGEGVVKVPDEVVAVVLGERHEGTAHHDKLHFVDTVSQLLQLDATSLSVSFVSKRYMSGVGGTESLVACLSEYLPLCSLYILHDSSLSCSIQRGKWRNY